jgi:TonB family protein
MANHTILLIDYEPRSIERFRQPLTAAGYRVEIATDGVAGVDAFHRLNPDMVLVEAMIPKKHGFEVCQELKRTPHGRRTPVIITTGVYKGRKYRTQALHIYGCDEYIEKPIAAEQLVAIVERFLSNTTPASREPVAATVDASEVATSMAGETPRSAPDAPPTRPPKPTSGPKAVVGDLTEDEIMARLDAILPVSSPIAENPPYVEPEPEMPPAEPLAPQASEPDSDPFRRMQAELTAELGSLSTALALEPAPLLEPVEEPMRSDQAVSPPLLESLPEPEISAPAIATAPGPDALAPGQVVSFDAKRSRKHKKSGRKHASPEHAEAGIELARTVTPPARPSKEIGIPSGTLVESALTRERSSRGIPAWAWIVVAAIALVVVYFVFWRGDSLTTRALPQEPPRIARAEAPPPVAREPSPPEAPAPAVSPGPDSKLVLNAVGPQPARSAPAPPVVPLSAPPKPAAKSTAPSTFAAPAKPTASTPVPAPAFDVGSADAGVEAIAPPAAEPPRRATTVAGSLIDLSEVDSPPASLTRKLPMYSMQARQMKLQGTVVLKVLVDERGVVEQVVVVSGIAGADLNDSAVKAARQWTYRPATKDGVPVKVWTTEQVTFKI